MNPARVLRAVAAAALGCALVGGASALDANTATRAELETIRGVGPALSSRIVEARRTQPFADLDDLKARVRGVGDANLRRMREAGLVVGASARVQTFVGQPDSSREPRPKRRSPVDAAAPAAVSAQPATASRRR